MSANSLVQSVHRFLRAHAPFSRMRDEDLDYVARRVELAYFADGEILVEPRHGTPGACWIVKQGLVEGLRPAAGGGDALEVVLRLGEGEVFPAGALLAKRPVTSTYRARGDTFCWRLDAGGFDELTRQSPVFLEFCRGRMAALLDLSREALQAAHALQTTQWRSMSRPIREILRGPALTCDESLSLREAFERMEAHGVGSLVITRAGPAGQATPVGIFTRQDVIGRVVLPGMPLETPIGAVMTTPLLTLDSRSSVAEAMLRMAEHGVRHLPVTDEDGLRGVVTERDLFVLQRRGLRQIGDSIRLAREPQALRAVAGDIREWSRSLVAQGISPEFITGLISRLNDQLTSRIVSMLAVRHGLDGSAFCWLALGSEGREEQTIATDQDNGLIIADGDPRPLSEWVRFGEAVNQALDDCGYPLCKGQIMAGNPAWCQPFTQWRALFDGWIERGDPTSLLNACVFFDFRGLTGDRSLANRLRDHVTDRAKANPRFLKQMSDNALRSSPPQGWSGGLLGQWFGTEAKALDLKAQGTVPLVDAARVLALAHGVRVTGTAARLQALAQGQAIRPDEARNWCDAFQYLQGLRLRVQHTDDQPAGSANHLRVSDLSDLDHRILREVFRQARSLQQRLAVDYPG